MTAEIKIKGIREGILVTVGDGEWPQVKRALLDHLQRQANFLRGAKLTLDVGNRILKAAEMGKLRNALSEMGLSLNVVLSDSPTTETTARALGLGTRISKPHPQRVARPLDTTIQGEQAILVHRTLRSGYKLEFPGHVTVIGDVNPGAEIIAGGSVVVWGRLRGMVHAGAEGDERAFVCALDLSPTQLRIAGRIAIAPQQLEPPQPEIAFLREGLVVAEPWTTSRKNI